MREGAITFFGNFGAQNLGNECTLAAIIQNLRKRVPDAAISCICPEPEETSARYGIPAFLMSYRYGGAFKGAPSKQKHPVVRLIRRLVLRAPLELGEWTKAFIALASTAWLVMPGTGMLGDFDIGPLDLHYEILKWCVIAKLRGCELLFVSVGAGPIEHPLSRWMVKSALSLADYRSYRDRFSKQYLESIGFDTSRDRVYPDLAFSFPRPETPPSPKHAAGRRVVGLGLMGYYGSRSSPEAGELIYRDYVDKLARFAAGLLERKYVVRLLIGDLRYDRHVKGDVAKALEQAGAPVDPGQLIDEPVESVEELSAQLAQTDVVVATRFHTVVLALMLGKPVLALSYHEKILSLMASAGLEEYCHDMATLDVPKLMQQFSALEENAAALAVSIEEKTGELRKALDEQYGDLFNRRLSAGAGGVS